MALLPRHDETFVAKQQKLEVHDGEVGQKVLDFP